MSEKSPFDQRFVEAWTEATKASFQERFQKALEERIPNPTCPLCGTKEWSVGDAVIWFNARFRTPTINNWANALPCGAITCNYCGNTQFIALIAYGETFKGDM